jgi:hypothetical protein
VHPTVAGCQVAESFQSLLLRRDCVEIGLLAAAAVTAGEGSPGDAEPPNRFCDRGISGILDGVAARRIEVGHPHHIVHHDLAEKHAVDVRVIDASSFEIWKKGVSPTRDVRQAKSFGRSSIDAIWPFSAGRQGYPARALRKG